MAIENSSSWRVGVLGGTFDPVHLGHLILGEEARDQLHLAQVIFVPAGAPPHKLGEPILAAKHRLAMLRLATKGNDHFGLSEVDLQQAGPCYTVETLKILRERWGASAAIYLLLGMDSLKEILTWHEPQQLIRQSHLAVAGRPGYSVDVDDLERSLPGLKECLTLLNMPQVDIASKDLRRRVREGRSIRYMVPASVEEYIQAQGLYREP